MKVKRLLNNLIILIIVFAFLPFQPAAAQTIPGDDDLIMPDADGRSSIPDLPNDPGDPVSGVWNLKSGAGGIKADLVWSSRPKSPLICLLDSGVQLDHPDLTGRVSSGKNLVSAGRAADDYGQGTRVAGIMVANRDNGVGSWGISNGKVVVYKVLDANGNGTLDNLIKGIKYCASKRAVKVIQISNWGPDGYQTAEQNALLYAALRSAIRSKKKLVVAAAGDGSTSNYYYPAAWADANVPGPNGTPNTIYGGLISVGAARKDNDIIVVNGTSDLNGCATPQTNYGRWVEMAAPGNEFLTTEMGSDYYTIDVVGHPYQEQWQGSSLAAAHVSAAAARLWSINSKKNYLWIHAQLVNSGGSLNLLSDPAVTDATIGYNIDANGDPGSNGYADEAPFCWPNANGPFGAEQDMTNARYLDLSKAMNRGAFAVSVVNATDGSTLPAQVRAIRKKEVFDTVLIDSNDLIGNGIAILRNLPSDKGFDLQVRLSGYTRGWQKFNAAPLTAVAGVTLNLNSPLVSPGNRRIGLVPLVYNGSNTDYSIVANWESTNDLDLSLWLPKPAGVDYPEGGIVGSSPYDVADPRTLGAGTRLDKPWAESYSRSAAYSGFRSQAISVNVKPRKKNLYYPGIYNIMLADTATANNLVTNDPFIRIWYKGSIRKVISGEDLACAADQDWWNIGTLQKQGKVIITNTCTNTVQGGYPY